LRGRRGSGQCFSGKKRGYGGDLFQRKFPAENTPITCGHMDIRWGGGKENQMKWKKAAVRLMVKEKKRGFF